MGAVSLRAIQAAAGPSVGSLRYHFNTEADLVKAVMERRVEPLMARHEILLEAVASNPDPETSEILRASIQPLLELLVTQPAQGMRYVTLMHRLQVGRPSGPHFSCPLARLCRAYGRPAQEGRTLCGWLHEPA
jgi:AcrR family transcriptional regulator